ncbi:RNA-dependent RNA polymerase [Favolaschia claudopus]|uniref:RNA-dependent RNA polymerase n=1 Tax=Favolaschia claudopus TaxID=2862362 RepID=A0AAW0E240_9AGAR
MEYNFNTLLDELVPPTIDARPPLRKPREPPAFSIKPHRFAMGSVQGAIFREEFNVEVDYSFMNLNFAEQSIFFKTTFDNAPFDWPILQATCSIDDLQTVRLVKHPYAMTATLTLTLRRPPRLEANFRRTAWNSDIGVRRATELDWSPDATREGGAGPPSTTPRGPWVDTPMKFGSWLTYRFDFSYTATEISRVKIALERLRTLDRPGTDKIAVEPEAEPQHLLTTTTPRRDPYKGFDPHNIDEELENAKYAFDARYLLIGLISQGLILPVEVSDIKHRLWPVPPSTRLNILRALFRLERRALVGPLAGEEIKKLEKSMSGSTKLRVPPGRVLMRRVVVTPTRILHFPEVIETSNRVLREWSDEMRDGRFIRVAFADEDGRIRVTKRIVDAEAANPNGGLLARIRNILLNGIYIAGRHYVFLAAGESQLKDHSCWMVCEDGKFTANAVRKQMGDFSRERVVAKYAARMGLCFSATRHVVDLVKDDIESLPDVKHNEEKYNFTDGVGNCSQALASRCAKALGSDQQTPSAVQIRMGGIKGVLSVHPHLEANQVCIRPSMEKFDSPLMGLGVMKVSRFAPAHLNRQAICIMAALGMNADALITAYKRQIQHAENLELELRALDRSRHPAKHVYKNAFIPIVAMIKAGLADQLLLQNVLKCIKCQLLRDLKYKARVLVPDGAFLMGVADEYDILEEGQIYCAITPSGPGSRQVIKGQCTIFRSPCIHPGDVRLVTAIDHPVFQELPLTNVVVFSTKKAARDLPSMLGGGDLDGDFYTVIYDKELQITRVHEPMDYTPVKPREKPDINMDNICDFVVDFIRSDVLGLVASNHLALADTYGPEHDLCLELAKLNSDAVDFPKSGVAVHIPQHLRPVRYPDFMGKDPEISYPSARVLGAMYRQIEPAPKYEPSEEDCIDTRITSRVIPTAYLRQAGDMKQRYDVELEQIMRQHSLLEAEIIAGVSIMSDQKRRRAADDAIRGPVREATDVMFVRFRRDARRFVKEHPSSNGLQTWAVACYQVTHVAELRSRWVDALNASRRGSAAVSDDGTEEGEYLEVTRRELISFPWLWAHDLCRSLADAVIKEEEEEDEDWNNRWDNQGDSDEEDEREDLI